MTLAKRVCGAALGRRSLLATGAEKRTALAYDRLLHYTAATRTGQAFAAVDGELLLEIACIAMYADIIAQCGAAGIYGLFQNLFDAVSQ